MRIRVPARLLLLLAIPVHLAGWSIRPAKAQNPPITRIERERVRGMLRAVRGEIERRYYDRTFHGVDLARRAAELDERIRQARTYSEALELVAQLPTTLRDSHTFFVPPQIPVSVSYGWSMLMVGDSCYVQQVEPGSDAATQGVKPGDRVLAVNGDVVTREHLWQVKYIAHVLRPQRWLRARIRSADGTVRDLRLNARVEPGFQALALTRMQDGGGIAGLIRAAELSPEQYQPRLEDRGDVLVWTLPTFTLTNEALIEARRRLHGRSALVLDLRGNGGGSVEALQSVLGMIFTDRVRVGTLVERGRERTLDADGGGAGAFAGPIIALVDSRTASAGEVLARLLQLTGRGVVIGDRTAGAVMHALQRQLNIGGDRGVLYGVSVTDAALVLLDGNELEKTGITPDELLLPTSAQMAAGDDPVMARALEIAAHPPAAAADRPRAAG